MDPIDNRSDMLWIDDITARIEQITCFWCGSHGSIDETETYCCIFNDDERTAADEAEWWEDIKLGTMSIAEITLDTTTDINYDHNNYQGRTK